MKSMLSNMMAGATKMEMAEGCSRYERREKQKLEKEVVGSGC